MLTTLVLLPVIGLLVGVAVKSLDRWIRLPYTVTLFVVGILFGLFTRTEFVGSHEAVRSAMDMITGMNPDFILYVFLPILVFDAAYEMDLNAFRKTLPNAALLAGPGVVICMLLTAAMVMGLYWLAGDYDASRWTYALMFGGLISATDPVAVVALLQELGTSKRFSTLVDGESLLNDATGLVCFMFFYGSFAGKEGIDFPLLYFAWVIACSCVIGYLVYRLTLLVVRVLGHQDVLQNCVVLAAAYITFMAAQSLLDVSGVIALVVFGHLFAQNGRPQLLPKTNAFMEKFWEFGAYLSNTLIFLIVGVIIAAKVDITWTHLFYTIIIYLGLNAIRYVMIAVLFPLLRRSGYGLTRAEAVVLGWGGLRGALGMCMALMVNCNENIPLETRHNILIYTAGVITLTLCVNATSCKWLVNRLRLAA